MDKAWTLLQHIKRPEHITPSYDTVKQNPRKNKRHKTKIETIPKEKTTCRFHKRP